MDEYADVVMVDDVVSLLSSYSVDADVGIIKMPTDMTTVSTSAIARVNFVFFMNHFPPKKIRDIPLGAEHQIRYLQLPIDRFRAKWA